MKLPADYLDLIRAGARALRSVGTSARDLATRSPDRPELWLAVRDFESLHGRLEEPDDWSWRHGFGNLEIAGQDLGVLDELLRGVNGVTPASAGEQGDIARLYDFLKRYLNGEYELE